MDKIIYALDTEGYILGSGVTDTSMYPEGTIFIEAVPSMGFMIPRWNFENQLWEEGSDEVNPIYPPETQETPSDTSSFVTKEEFTGVQQLALNLYQQLVELRRGDN